MILRIKTSDFSNFGGYKYNSPDCNKELDKYINLFKNHLDIKYFQIEDSTGNSLDFHTVCYIKDQLNSHGEVGMFTKTDFDIDGKIERYWLCFYKK